MKPIPGTDFISGRAPGKRGTLSWRRNLGALLGPGNAPEPLLVRDRDDHPRLVRIGPRQGDARIAGLPEAGEDDVDHFHRPPQLARDGE